MQRLLKKLAVDVLCSPICSAIMQPIRSQVVPIFMLHRIENKKLKIPGHKVAHIKSALNFLEKNHYSVISLNQVIDSLLYGNKLPSRSVAFTIDDGFDDQASIVLPIFQAFNMPITLFIATDMPDHQDWSWDYKIEYIINKTNKPLIDITLLGKSYHFDLNESDMRRIAIRILRQDFKEHDFEKVIEAVEKLSHYADVEIMSKAPEAYKGMTWQQAKELESDFITFGPHTCSHSVLSKLDSEYVRHEISQSQLRLSQELKKPVSAFCYPTGREGKDFGEREKLMVKEASFKCGLSADPGYVDLKNKSKNDIFALKRFTFPDNITDFKQYCSWIERAKELIKI